MARIVYCWSITVQSQITTDRWRNNCNFGNERCYLIVLHPHTKIGSACCYWRIANWFNCNWKQINNNHRRFLEQFNGYLKCYCTRFNGPRLRHTLPTFNQLSQWLRIFLRLIRPIFILKWRNFAEARWINRYNSANCSP